MMYFKRYWDEPRGPLDETSAWGCSWWYFEVDDAGVVQRQIEVYDNGPTLHYSMSQPLGKYGGLADKTLDFPEFAPFEIGEDVFEQAWKSATQS